MDNFTCSPVTSVRQYIILLDDELMGRFVENPLVVSCGLKTRCRISITNKVLNRSVRPGFWNRYFIVNVIGADHFAIERCNRLLERHIPQYRQRQRYRCKSHVTLFTNEWLPDNSPVCETKMRMGAQRSKFGNLKIFSPYANHKFRNAWQTPWKISNRENLGHYEIHDLYRPLLAKATTLPSDYPNANPTSCTDIEMFNWPNSFDRYTTFQSIDNENIKLAMQQHCIRYMNILRSSSKEPPTLRQIPDERQSSKYTFERNAKSLPIINATTSAINSMETIYSQLGDLTMKKLKPPPRSIKPVPKCIETINEEEENGTNGRTMSDEVIIEYGIELNKNNLVNFVSDENQNFILKPSSFISTNAIMQSQKEKKKRKISKGIRLNRYIRLYHLKAKSKCINYKILSNSKTEKEIESDITWVSSNWPSDSKLSTKASKASNFEDNTMDSLKSL